MNKHFQNLDKAFENKVRLGIMSILMIEDTVNFNSLKETLKLTDGNLASHLKALEKLGYITVIKSFIGRKPNTNYSSSKIGMTAFNKHITALEELLKSMK